MNSPSIEYIMKTNSKFSISIYFAQDWKLRSNAICAIEDAIKSPENLATIQPCLESFLKMLLSSERHPDVVEDKRRILINLCSRLPLDNFEKRAGQLTIGLCRQGGAGSNRVAKALMQRLLPTTIVHRLMSDDFLKARSSRVFCSNISI